MKDNQRKLETLRKWHRRFERINRFRYELWLIVFVLFLIGAVLSACAGYVSRGGDTRATLSVQNDGTEVVHVYDPYSQLGVVYPNEKRCLILPQYSGQVHLYLRTSEEEVETPYLDPSTLHWTIQINTLPLQYSAITLQPTETNCRASH